MFRCLQRVAVAKTLFSVILANGLGKLLEEAFSQLELVVGSLHALWSSKTLHLVGNVRPVLYCSSVGLAFLRWSSILPILFPASKNVLFCFPFEIAQGRERVFGLSLQAGLCQPICMLIALDVPVSWNPAKMDLVAMQYKLLAQLCYLMADFLASSKRDLLQSFQSSLAVYKDVNLLAL
jgi:hypothetical protein